MVGEGANRYKKNYPNFTKHTINEKKTILKDIYDQVIDNIDVNADENISKHELLNMEPLPKNIISIDQMKILMKEK